VIRPSQLKDTASEADLEQEEDSFSQFAFIIIPARAALYRALCPSVNLIPTPNLAPLPDFFPAVA
jgi:hypothetical protein